MASNIPECSICFNDFTESDINIPLVLTCGHTFCKKCLLIIIENGKTCVKCRKEILYDTVSEIPLNYELINVLSGKVHKCACNKNTGYCFIHKSQVLNERCITCGVWICNSCRYESHLKNCKISSIESVVIDEKEATFVLIQTVKEKLERKRMLLQEKISELDKLNLATIQISNPEIVTTIDQICKIREIVKENYVQDSEENSVNIVNRQPIQKEVDIIIKSFELMGHAIKVFIVYIMYTFAFKHLLFEKN